MTPSTSNHHISNCPNVVGQLDRDRMITSHSSQPSSSHHHRHSNHSLERGNSTASNCSSTAAGHRHFFNTNPSSSSSNKNRQVAATSNLSQSNTILNSTEEYRRIRFDGPLDGGGGGSNSRCGTIGRNTKDQKLCYPSSSTLQHTTTNHIILPHTRKKSFGEIGPGMEFTDSLAER